MSKLEEQRKKMNEIDLEIARLLCERFQLSHEIGVEKYEKNISIVNKVAKKSTMEMYTKVLGDYGMYVYEAIHNASVQMQCEIFIKKTQG